MRILAKIPFLSFSYQMLLWLQPMFVTFAHADSHSIGASISTDEARSAWQYRRRVSLTSPKDQPGFASLSLPPEVIVSSQSEGHDLRLLVFSNQAHMQPHEVSYILQSRLHLQNEKFSGTLVDTQSVPDQKTMWLIDFSEIHDFNSLALEIPDTEFAKHIKIEAADQKTGPFRLLLKDAGIFDRAWNTAEHSHLHQTEITFPSTEKARFVRITVDDKDGPPISLTGAQLHHTGQVGSGAGMWSRQVTLVPIPSDAKDGTRISRYRIELPQYLPIEGLSLVTTDQAPFVRLVRFYEIKSNGKKELPDKKLLGHEVIYQVDANHLPKQTLAPGPLSSQTPVPEVQHTVGSFLVVKNNISLSNSPKGKIFLLEIENQDSPPLKDIKVSLSGPTQSLLFPVEPGQKEWVLYYGNPQTRAPVYDLAQLQEYIEQMTSFYEVSIDEEQLNPVFHPAPPLEFLNSVGASLDPHTYRMSQSIILPAKEDLYMMILPAVDLASLKTNLDDLRIVNAQNQQIPYIVESDTYERSVDLKVTPLLVKDNPHLSRYQVQFWDQGHIAAIPLRALDVEVKEQFFVRSIRVIKPPENDSKGEGTVIAIGQMEHRGDQGSLQRIPLPGFEDRYRELILEIDNQDNAPLLIHNIRGLVAVPRISFKLKPEGNYRLLLGNEQAEKPHYDLQHLAAEVLSYSARPAELGDLVPNPDYRPETKSIASWFSSKLLIPIVLGIATLLLLVLSIRLISRGSQEEAKEETSAEV